LIASRMALRVRRGVFFDPLIIEIYCSNKYSSTPTLPASHQPIELQLPRIAALGDDAAAKALELSLTYGGLDALLMNGAGPQPHGRRGTARRPSVRERCLGLRSRAAALGVGRPSRLNRHGIATCHQSTSHALSRSLSASKGVTVEGTATSTSRPTGLEPVAFSHHRHPGAPPGRGGLAGQVPFPFEGNGRSPGAAKATQDNHAA
jgi:hypothetical protein